MVNLSKNIRWRHKKRGTTYSIVTGAIAQCATGPIVDGDIVTVYVGDDGRAFVRKTTEFLDGRFEEIE